MKKFFFSLFLLFITTSSIYGIEALGLYLTLESDPLTTMTVRWVTTKSENTSTLYYREIDSNQWYVAEGQHVMMPDLQPYLIHYCQLTHLTPNTQYEVLIDNLEEKFIFKTLSEELDTLRFIVGGDMYHDELQRLIEMNKNAASLNPDFILLGGDLAYSSPHISFFFSEDIQQWLDWLKASKEGFITPSGKRIPLVLAIGNHEVAGRYNKTFKEAKYFYSLFRFPSTAGYYSLHINDYFSLVVLDSGHTHPIEGNQTNWLNNTLKNSSENSMKFAIYHVPAFPSVRNFNQKTSTIIRQNWVPLFEKFGVQAAFEHHDHAYKRTYPLINFKLDPNGVLYLGDGAWGVKKPRIPKNKKNNPFLATTFAKQHFIQVTLTKEIQKYEAIDNNMEIFDTYLRTNKR